MLDPGETADMVITIINSGHAEAYSVKASLTSADQYITVNTTTPQSLGNMTPEQSIPATFPFCLARYSRWLYRADNFKHNSTAWSFDYPNYQFKFYRLLLSYSQLLIW